VRIALALVSLLLAGAAASCSGGEQTQPTRATADIARELVLGIVWHENEAVLQRFGRTELTPRPGRVELGHSGGAWSFSPDKAKLATAGGSPLEVRIVDVRRMLLEDVVPLPRNLAEPPEDSAVALLAWPTARSILALIEWGAWEHALVVVDPVAGGIVSEETIDGALVGQARTRDGFALLLAPVGRIGPSRLLLVDSAGDQRSIALAEVPAGLETIDPQRPVQRLELPALAVDPIGARALVVPAAGPLAEIELTTGHVAYREVREPVSLFGRLRKWLEPTAEAKAAEGSARQAVWVSQHLIAVSGQDTRRLAKGHEETAPAGLTLIDVRDWTTRILDEQASQFSFSAGTLLAYGTSWSSAAQKTTGMGLTAYGLDGEERFHLFGDDPIYFVETAGPYAYIWRDGASPVAVDLRTGIVSSRLDRYRGDDLPALVLP
jgi:hypothetical protein